MKNILPGLKAYFSAQVLEKNLRISSQGAKAVWDPHGSGEPRLIAHGKERFQAHFEERSLVSLWPVFRTLAAIRVGDSSEKALFRLTCEVLDEGLVRLQS